MVGTNSIAVAVGKTARFSALILTMLMGVVPVFFVFLAPLSAYAQQEKDGGDRPNFDRSFKYTKHDQVPESQTLSVDDEVLKTAMAVYTPMRRLRADFQNSKIARADYLDSALTLRGVTLMALGFNKKILQAALEQQSTDNISNQLVKQLTRTITRLSNDDRALVMRDVDEKLEACLEKALQDGAEPKQLQTSDSTKPWGWSEQCSAECGKKTTAETRLRGTSGGAQGSNLNKMGSGTYAYCVCCAETAKNPNQLGEGSQKTDSPSDSASYRSGDMNLADKYARKLVRMQINYFFEVRQLTKLIGEALVRENVIDVADWLGAEQMLEMEMARTRKEMNTRLKPDHDSAMKRIVPDEKGKATAFYFFSMQCSWCRDMAPDIERLHQIAKADPNFDLHILTIGQAPKRWIDEYKSYAGITAEIKDGEDFARSFNIGLVPALIVVSPTGNRSYLKSGKQSFSRMYQFVRRIQGKDAQLTPEINALIERPIGRRELEVCLFTRSKQSLSKSHCAPEKWLP